MANDTQRTANLNACCKMQSKINGIFENILRQNNNTSIKNGDQMLPTYVIHTIDTCLVLNDRHYKVLGEIKCCDEKHLKQAVYALNKLVVTMVAPAGTTMIRYQLAVQLIDMKTANEDHYDLFSASYSPMQFLQEFLDGYFRKKVDKTTIWKVSTTCIDFPPFVEDEDEDCDGSDQSAAELKQTPAAELKQTPIAALGKTVDKQQARVAKLRETQTKQFARLAELTKELTDLGKAIALTAAQLKELPDTA
jgi:hypothetical protein